MQIPYILVIYFFYGLAFFSMGLLVAIEGGRAPDARLRRALRPLAAFGLVHAVNEWMEMFEQIGALQGYQPSVIVHGIRLAVLAFSFLSLAAFGSSLLAFTEAAQRVSLLIPLGLEAVWVFGLTMFRGDYIHPELLSVADVWTRYTLGIPAGVLSAAGLIAQQRAFRRSGLIRFGQDSLWAAVAFGWYGLVGQIFVQTSPLPPSNALNQQLFLEIFGFPVQLFRAAMAVLAAVFVIRFLRAFQVEIERKIAELQEARLREARRHEALRGELFRRVVEAQEAERQRIARDLHDETGQALTAIGMGLRGLSTSLEKSDSKSRKGAIETLRHLENLSADSLHELQRLIADLRPSHLDDLGLPAAIRWYAAKVQERADFSVKVEIEGQEQPVSPAVKIAIFRIVQEAINNVIKHAAAQRVHIRLTFEPQGLRVHVQDDGLGFDPTAIRLAQADRPSLGLAGMEERAALLGGSCTVDSQPKRGTVVEAAIPYGRDEEASNEHPAAAGG